MPTKHYLKLPSRLRLCDSVHKKMTEYPLGNQKSKIVSHGNMPYFIAQSFFFVKSCENLSNIVYSISEQVELYTN